jgi:dipeptidase E
MSLVLYSGGFPEENESLDKILFDIQKKKSNLQITFIPSCSYFADTEFEEFVEQYKKFNVKKIIKFQVDLPFSEIQKKIAFDSDIIHLSGGNTYYFLKHLRKNNMLSELKSWNQNGGILTGLSAGAIIMTKNIATAGFPSFDKDDNDEGINNLKGMELVDFEFFPHYKNSKRYDQELIAHSKTIKTPLYACPDGSGIVVQQDQIRFIGRTACFHNGQKYFVNK